MDYQKWVKDLCSRYRQSQIKAAVKVNVEQLKYNWLLGHDIVEMRVKERWGESVITQLSKDLRQALPNAGGIVKEQYLLLQKVLPAVQGRFRNFPPSWWKNDTDFFHQVGGIFEVPWRHHCLIMDKVKGNADKALFYVRQTVENGWSRSMLLNFISTDPLRAAGQGSD